MKCMKYIWHYDVHRRYQESLLYLQLAFLPVYHSKKIHVQIQRLLSEKGICSFCIYETYGHYDIILRAWLPSKESPQGFIKELQDKLVPLGCIRAVPFYVEDNPLHWKWADSKPSTSDLSTLSSELVNKVDKNDVNDDAIRSLVKANVLAAYSPAPGIKFFIVVPRPPAGDEPTQSATITLIESLRELLADTLDITEPSLYLGTGFAWILVKGKIPFDRFPILGIFIQKINETGVKLYQVRTYTYLVTDSAEPSSVEREAISGLAINNEGEINIEDFLKREEDDHFEVKGSFMFNIDRYLKNPSQMKELPQNNEIFRDKSIAHNVCKTVAAFLNTNGGKIILGALEAKRYVDILDAKDGFLKRYPQIDQRIIIGIDDELSFKEDGWDGFQRKLVEHVETIIGRNASALINLTPNKYNDRTICIVDVPKGADWFYVANKEFWVRRASANVQLDGHEADSYKKLRKRGG